jgi:Putative beta-barrel porin-2, OmpL-like. bbp2
MRPNRILGFLASAGLVFLFGSRNVSWAQAPSAPAPCPPAAASAVAALRASWPQALSAAAASCPEVPPSPAAAPKPAAAPSPVAAATPVPPLTSPAVTGPLTWQSPTAIDLSKMLGLNEIAPPISDLFKFDINGVVSGIGIVQNHAVSGDRSSRADASNAQVIIQKPEGLIQYYLQVGAYSIPELGAAYVSSGNAVNRLWGPLPEGYIKIAPTSNFSLLAGNLPTLYGQEYTFTFENVNIERGLLWSQETAINRGVQVNYTLGPVSAALTWNNGFYSNSYTWVDGSLAWAINPTSTFSFVGGGQVGFSKFSNFATPVLLNNSQIYDIEYTYSSAPWIVQPYLQFTVLPHHPELGVFKTTSTSGAALLLSYALTNNFFLSGRVEGITSSGSPTDGSANLLYGPGSNVWSLTLTPTYQYKNFFARAEASFVQAVQYTPGDVFGSQNRNPVQVRGLLETGIVF